MIKSDKKLPDTTEVENDNGTKTRISFKYKNNKIIKTTTIYKLVTDTVKKSKRVIERNERLKNKKFGNAKSDSNNITFIDNECKILTPSEWEDEDYSNINENVNMKIGIYNKNQGKRSYNNNQVKGRNNNNQSKEIYNNKMDNFNYYSIRISNISNNITENDLYDLVSIFGPVKKIIIAKDRDTRKSKGYAFVNFSDKISAKNALTNLNGHGYDNMILKVEYSRNIN